MNMDSPCFMSPGNSSSTWKVFDSCSNKLYDMDFPDHEVGDQICFSNYGWLLMCPRGGGPLYFLNPVTKEKRQLPPVTCGFQATSCCFTAPPTCSDCCVFGIVGDTNCETEFALFKVKDHEWDTSLLNNCTYRFWPSHSSPPFWKNGVFYLLDWKHTKIMTFDPNRDYECQWLLLRDYYYDKDDEEEDDNDDYGYGYGYGYGYDYDDDDDDEDDDDEEEEEDDDDEDDDEEEEDDDDDDDDEDEHVGVDKNEDEEENGQGSPRWLHLVRDYKGCGKDENERESRWLLLHDYYESKLDQMADERKKKDECESKRCFMVEVEGEIWGVFAGDRSKELSVAKLDVSEGRWNEVESLGNKCLYVSSTGCFAETCGDDSERANRIYFHRCHEIYLSIYHSLDSNSIQPIHGLFNPSGAWVITT